MTEENRKKIRASFISLSKETRNEVTSQESSDAFYAIAEKYKVTKEKIPFLVEATSLVIYGVEPEEKFAELIKTIVGLDDATAQNIAREVKEKLVPKAVKEKFAEGSQTRPTPSSTPIRPSLRSEGPTSFDTVEVVGEEKPKIAVVENINQADVLEGIEHPTAFPAVFEKPGLPAMGFVADKLSKVVTAPKTTTDIKTAPAPKYSQDPYRESTE